MIIIIMIKFASEKLEMHETNRKHGNFCPIIYKVAMSGLESVSAPLKAPCSFHYTMHMSQRPFEIVLNKGHFTYICQLP